MNLSGPGGLVGARVYNIRIPVWGEVDEDGILSKDTVVVFSSPDAFSPLMSDHCTAVVLFSQGSCMGKV